MSEWFVRLLRLIEPSDKLVRVKSWRPVIYWEKRELWWPCLLIDRRGGSRITGWPVWDWPRIRDVLRIPPPKPQPPFYGPM